MTNWYDGMVLEQVLQSCITKLQNAIILYMELYGIRLRTMLRKYITQLHQGVGLQNYITDS